MTQVLWRGLSLALPLILLIALAWPGPVQARPGHGVGFSGAQGPGSGLRIRVGDHKVIGRHGGKFGGFRRGFHRPKFGNRHFRKRRGRGNKRNVFLIPNLGFSPAPEIIIQQPAPEPQNTEAQPAAQALYKAPGPKWIHVGADENGALLSGGSSLLGSETDSGNSGNCLSVRTEVLVEGTPVEAFGKTCQGADGTWHLLPDEGG